MTLAERARWWHDAAQRGPRPWRALAARASRSLDRQLEAGLYHGAPPPVVEVRPVHPARFRWPGR